ncbi:MAG: WS/DGAT/MGAT family O-acyltransferase [Sciscionella sp.]
MSLMPLNDSMFLLGESREHPLHVGGLQLFTLPEGAGPDYLRQVHRELVATENSRVHRSFRQRPQTPVGTVGQLAWRQDANLDLGYHVRHSALPRPGRVRELLELTSRLHGSLLDRHRPLWEMHLIEGLHDRRFAIYTKVHHALMDGVSALHQMQRVLSTDPDERELPATFGWRPRPAAPAAATQSDPLWQLGGIAKSALGLGRGFGEALGVLPTVLREAQQALRDQQGALPYQAPRSMLNVPITGARRFAAQSWSMDRIKPVCQATGSTTNDVVLALCAGALRKYLLDAGALPDRGLVAMVPVSLRRKAAQQSAGSGNNIGAILCDLATDEADPQLRLRRIQDSVRYGKQMLSGVSPLQAMLLSAVVAGGLALAPLPGMASRARPPFNLIISNVPGPSRPLYWNGAAMQGLYPMSIPYEGQALNITVTSYAGNLEFGLTGCRRSVPHLQRMLVHLEASLVALERLTG